MNWKSFINFLTRFALWLGERFFAFVKLIGRLDWMSGHAVYKFGERMQQRCLDWMKADAEKSLDQLLADDGDEWAETRLSDKGGQGE